VIRNVVARAGVMVVVLAFVFGSGCGSGPAVRADADAGAPDPCSQLHRAISRWQGDSTEYMQCGPDVTALLELTPIGYHQLVARRRFSSPYDVWTVSATGGLPDAPTVAPAMEGGLTAGVVFMPGPTPHTFIYDPLDDGLRFATTLSSPDPGQNWFESPSRGHWLPDSFHHGRPGPAGHQLLGLEDGQLLDRDLGDGSTRVWRIVKTGGTDVDVAQVSGLVGGARDELSRGHRVVPVGGGRLLEWQPRACDGAAPSAARDCAAYRVWPYTLDATVAHDPVGAQPRVTGVRSDIGGGDDILADDTTLYVWTRATGRLRSAPLDPTAADPLPPQGQAWPGDVVRPQLVSQDWDPPTASPAIKHLVVILQDGRSFDSYFGQYCQSPMPSISDSPNCDGMKDGRMCCEAMPPSVAGAAACTPIGPVTDADPPHFDPACMRWKMADGAMTRFAVPNPDDKTCGSALDFACAGPDVTAGTPTDYWDLLPTSTLADNFFQTYTYADGAQGPFATLLPIQNLLYLETARFADTTALDDTPLLTKSLAHVQVPWAIYAGDFNLGAASAYNPGAYYDPDWYPYRTLAGELDRDIAIGALPSVVLVVPDATDLATSEAPGHPVGPAIAFVKHVQDEIVHSPLYGTNTLVLLTYLTAGGYYDHVFPPAPLDTRVDGSSRDPTQTGAVYYGPRVPLLAFSPFARKNQISHVRLELTSITRFIEWNWQRDNTLRGGFDEARRYRDTVVKNLGSLIDPDAAQIEVPIGTE